MNIEFIFPKDSFWIWLVSLIFSLTLLVLALRLLDSHRRDRLAALVDANLLQRLLRGYDARIRRPLFWLTVLGFLFIGVTLAQPQWGQAWQDVRRVSRDIVVCLDTSESMRAEQPVPNRLERARQEVNALLDRAPADRFALVAFSGRAALQCPLTLDHGYFSSVLNAVDTDTISAEGTNIAAALEEATELFKDEEERVGEAHRESRAILLISDGETLPDGVLVAAEGAAKYARIYVIGIGDPEGAYVTKPRIGRGFGEEQHLSQLDEKTLMAIAEAGEGVYLRSRADTQDVEQLYQLFQNLSGNLADSQIRIHLINRYRWALALAFACFTGEGIWIVMMPLIRRWRMGRQESAEPEEHEYA